MGRTPHFGDLTEETKVESRSNQRRLTYALSVSFFLFPLLSIRLRLDQPREQSLCRDSPVRLDRSLFQKTPEYPRKTLQAKRHRRSWTDFVSSLFSSRLLLIL